MPFFPFFFWEEFPFKVNQPHGHWASFLEAGYTFLFLGETRETERKAVVPFVVVWRQGKRKRG